MPRLALRRYPSPLTLGFDEATTRMLVAVARNSGKRVTKAIVEGGDPNAVGKDGLTPLVFALGRERNTAAVEALLLAGADPNHVEANPDGATFMGGAVAARKPTLLKVALVHGADPDHTSGVDTALGLAVSARRPYNMVALLNAGADPNLTTPAGLETPPLALALTGRSWVEAWVLLRAGADALYETPAGSTAASALHGVDCRADSPDWLTYKRVLRQLAAGGVVFPAIAPSSLRSWRQSEADRDGAPRALADLSGMLATPDGPWRKDFNPYADHL